MQFSSSVLSMCTVVWATDDKVTAKTDVVQREAMFGQISAQRVSDQCYQLARRSKDTP